MTEAHMNKYAQAYSEPKSVKYYDAGHELMNPTERLTGLGGCKSN